MKIMTKMLLIHWHYFIHEVISFGQLNFLTGKNASGKSTVIDAMQVVLYGDTSGNFFNKAANGKGNRTLYGYLCGELGDNEESGYKYLRSGRFTSYIALEFYDDVKERYFTAGCCFDIYSENDMQKLFFRYDGAFPENEFVSDEVPMNIQKLRNYLKTEFANHSYTTDVGRNFRSDLYGKLGGLREQFSQLMKKAVSFDPNVDIQKFISEFVCNSQQTVDTSQMQENIRSYRRLEEEADILREKMELLENISETYQTYQKNKKDALMYKYLLDRADTEISAKDLTKEREKKESLIKCIKELKNTIFDEKKCIEDMRSERDDLNIQLGNNEQAQTIKMLEDKISEKEKILEKLNTEYSNAEKILFKNILAWKNGINQMIEKLNNISYDIGNAYIQNRIEDIKSEANQNLHIIESMRELNEQTIEKIGEKGFIECSNKINELNTHSIQLSTSTEEEQHKLTEEKKELSIEKDILSKGIYQFPKDVTELKKAVESRLRTVSQKDVFVVIVAEASEIRSERWRNAIEGYLHTQKFYLIVPPEYYQIAVNVYDEIKHKNEIYGTGIVDIEKMARKNPIAEAGSLAEEIKTDDPNVRLFLDYTLGRVIKCERVTDLRRYRTAITDEGMLYQNFVVRAMNPERWKKPAIGQSAIKSRLEVVKREIELKKQEIIACSTIKIALDRTSNLPLFSESEVQQSVNAARNKKDIPTITADIARFRESRAKIDESAVKAIKAYIDVLDKKIYDFNIKYEEDNKKLNTDEEKLRRCCEEEIPKYEKVLEEKEINLNSAYEKSWVEEIGSVRYERELLSRGSADNIYNAFPRELARVENKQNDMWINVQDLRRRYNEKYKMGYDILNPDNDIFDDLWLELSENQLPQYMIRIQDTKNKAFEQFREDFLSRLEHNIEDARQQINGLNQALKGSSFGEDTYKFLIVPKPEYKRYYDMIVDPMKLEGGYNLFSEQFNAKYKNEIDDLFAILTNENSSSKDGHSEDEKRVRMFTDYRTYLSFDLEVINRDGDVQRLSRTMGKKSGGETQTPFYIAVLASFVQLYRIGRDKTNNTARLIIFDEAFSKMDGERISRSVELLRHFKFQAILSAPPDKIGDIAPYVDSSICVLREGKRSCIRSFDSTKLEDLYYE